MRPRVLIVRQAYYRDDPRPQRQLRALCDAGYHVDVVCLRGQREPSYERKPHGAIYRLPVGKRRGTKLEYLAEYAGFLVAATALVTLLHLRHRYRAIQVHNIPDILVFAGAVPRALGTPVVLDMTEVVPELVQSKFGVDRRHPLVRVAAALERLSTAFASRVIVVSRPAQAAAAGRGLPGRKTLTIMNSPDPAIFPSAARKPSPRLALGPRLISHGTLVDRYGFDTLIEAMPHILERHPSAKLQVLGDGPLRGRLEEIVSARNLAEHVELCGQVPLTEIAARLRVADLGIVANRRDPFTDLVVPTKLMEYAVMGVPVAAARTSAIEEYFGESVALFDPGDPASLGDVVARLLSAPDERARLACAAEAVVRNELDWERHMARDYVRLYDHLTVSSQDAM